MTNQFDALQKTTEEWLYLEGVEITLRRREQVRDPAGGQGWSDWIDQPSRIRLLSEIYRDSSLMRSRNDYGSGWVTTHQITGTYDDPMQAGDRFTMNDDEYRIVHISPLRRWETKGEVATRINVND